MLRQVVTLIEKELKLEFRQKAGLGGILLYVVSTTFVCYLSFRSIVDIPTWNALFWIIVLFSALNAASKSFGQETNGTLLYLYSLTSPKAIILSKTIYNAVLISATALITAVIYALLLGNVIGDYFQFLLVVFIGSMGLASTFTLINGIAAKTSNNVSLMAILSFPVVLPLLLTIIHASKNAIDGLNWSVNEKYILVLAALNALIFALSYLLFPYLWRD